MNPAPRQAGKPTDAADGESVGAQGLAPGNAAAQEAQAREAALIVRILAGERELFHDLIRPYERGLYLACYAVLLHEADSEDAAQEAVIKAYKALKNFRGESRFGTWLTAIALNESRSRRRKSREESLDAYCEGEDAGGDYTPSVLADWRYIPSQALEQKELRQILQGAMAKLSPAQREVLFLRDVRGLNVAETAAATGVNEGLVKVRLFRARLSMQKLLAPQLGSMQLGSQSGVTPGGLMGWLTRKASGLRKSGGARNIGEPRKGDPRKAGEE